MSRTQRGSSAVCSAARISTPSPPPTPSTPWNRDERRRFEKHLQGCDRCAAEVRAAVRGRRPARLVHGRAAPLAMRDRVLSAIRTTPQESPGRSPGHSPRTPPDVGRSAPQAEPSTTGARLGHRTAAAVRRAPRMRPIFAPLATPRRPPPSSSPRCSPCRRRRPRTSWTPAQAQAREIAHVLVAPDARATADRDARGQGIRAIASASEGRAVVTLSGYGEPPSGRVHQSVAHAP